MALLLMLAAYVAATVLQLGAPGDCCSARWRWRAGAGADGVGAGDGVMQLLKAVDELTPACAASAACADADTLPVLPSTAAQDMPGKLT